MDELLRRTSHLLASASSAFVIFRSSTGSGSGGRCANPSAMRELCCVCQEPDASAATRSLVCSSPSTLTLKSLTLDMRLWMQACRAPPFAGLFLQAPARRRAYQRAWPSSRHDSRDSACHAKGERFCQGEGQEGGRGFGASKSGRFDGPKESWEQGPSSHHMTTIWDRLAGS